MTQQKNIHVVAAVMLKDNKILCTQRNGTKTLPYKWEFPGGKIETGETKEEALHREIGEELHCKIKIHGEIGHAVHEYDFGTVHLTLFECSLHEGEPILTEHEAMKWMKRKDLLTLDWAPADIPLIEQLSEA